MSSTPQPPRRAATQATHLGRHPEDYQGFVNPPIYHASTVLFPTVAKLEQARNNRYEYGSIRYGRFGTPLSLCLERAIAELEGGYGAVSVSSGLAAITTALGAFSAAGDHILVCDNVYHPTRLYCDEVLARYGVSVSYYEPLLGAGIEEMIRDNTRAIYMESPGSQTFEVQDVPAISRVAQQHGITTIIDNTWATPLYFNPIALGVDISIHAATKYIVGHSDAMLGIVVANEAHFDKLSRGTIYHGHCAGPDSVYLGLRGLRTLPARMKTHQDNAVQLATWLAARAEVERVLHPALPGDPGHALWQRDFSGASGLFGVVLNDAPKQAIAAMLDGLELFGMGFSWGGFESLCIPVHPGDYRISPQWADTGPMLRIHAGLEDIVDLQADLDAGFERLRRVANGVD